MTFFDSQSSRPDNEALSNCYIKASTLVLSVISDSLPSPTAERQDGKLLLPYTIPKRHADLLQVQPRLLQRRRHARWRHATAFSPPPSSRRSSPPLRRILPMLSSRYAAWPGTGKRQPRRKSHDATERSRQAHKITYYISYDVRAQKWSRG